MFRLFSKILRGLEPVSQIFKQVRTFAKLAFWIYKVSYACCLDSTFLWFLIVCVIQHVTAEGTALVKQAEDAASSKKVSSTYFSKVEIQH